MIKTKQETNLTQIIYKVNDGLYIVAENLAELEKLFGRIVTQGKIRSVEIFGTINGDGQLILSNREPVRIDPPTVPIPDYPKKKTWPYVPDKKEEGEWIPTWGKNPSPYPWKYPGLMYMSKNDHENTTHICPPVNSFEYWCRMDNK